MGRRGANEEQRSKRGNLGANRSDRKGAQGSKDAASSPAADASARKASLLKAKRFLANEPELAPCENCGRVMLAGKCCNDPRFNAFALKLYEITLAFGKLRRAAEEATGQHWRNCTCDLCELLRSYT